MRGQSGRRYVRRCLGVFLLFAGLLQTTASTPAAQTYRDWPEWERLPRFTDWEDEACGREWTRFVSEAGQEGLLAIVTECEDMEEARTALNALRECNGEKREAIEKLKPFFVRRLPVAGEREGWLLTDIAKFLADYGDEEDMEVLIPMLEHPNRRMPVLGARHLGARGGRRALVALEAARNRGGQGRLLEEIEMGIAAIESRLEWAEGWKGGRFSDAELGVQFGYSGEFAEVQVEPKGRDGLWGAALEKLGVGRGKSKRGLAEKRLLEGGGAQWVREGEVPAIVLERHPAVSGKEGEAGGLWEYFAACTETKRIGGNEVHELPGCPRWRGRRFFCWLVKLPDGWLTVTAPRYFEEEEGVEKKRRPTGYDREIRRILETLEVDGGGE